MRRLGAWLLALAMMAGLAGAFAATAQAAGRALPSMVLPSARDVTLSRGDTAALEARVFPSGSDQRVLWVSEAERIATVSPEGVVLAREKGVAVITAVSALDASVKARVQVTVSALARPVRVVLESPGKRVALGNDAALTARVLPDGASQSVAFFSSNKKVATVSAAGVVTPISEGKVKITARSQAKKTVAASVTLTVYDPLKPTAVSIEADAQYMSLGASQVLRAVVEPEGADASVQWKSDKPGVLEVDDAGAVTARAPGKATITCTAKRGAKRAQAQFTVLNSERTTAVPARTTAQSPAAIRENLASIDRVFQSAVNELEATVAKRQITQQEFAKRRKILVNAFSMYRFPWYTGTRVDYWSSAYDGAKDFRPGRVYYGLPYIQTGRDGKYTNRRYNVTKALQGGYYGKGSGGCYKLTGRRMAGRYVGNDCSAFVCMATFAGNGYTLESPVCYLVTRTMMTSTAFKTIGNYNALRPGDALVLSGLHTVMFLYYVDGDKDRMMIIEQGGGNNQDMHNTVTCSVVNRSSYEGKYRIRRAKFLKA